MTASKNQSLICVVDDDSAVRNSVVVLVESLGCTVAGFASGEEFLASPKAAEPSYLIVDVRLPGMTGVELLEAMADRKTTPPSVVMTGHADVDCLALDFWPNQINVLSKPCDPAQLLKLIDDTLTS